MEVSFKLVLIIAWFDDPQCHQPQPERRYVARQRSTKDLGTLGKLPHQVAPLLRGRVLTLVRCRPSQQDGIEDRDLGRIQERLLVVFRDQDEIIIADDPGRWTDPNRRE